MSPHEPAREIARGKWTGLLGKWLDERALAGKHTKCPMCGGKDRWRLDDKDGSGSWICNHCGAGDGFHLLQHLNGWTFQEAAKYVEQQAGKIRARPVAAGRSDVDIRNALQGVWKGAGRVERGDPVWRYLERRCAVTEAPAGVRTHPALPYTDEDGVITRHPAMLAQVLDNAGEALTIHRLWLTADGQKAAVSTPRKLMSPLRKMDSAAIRLAPVADGWLGVAEGAETALCASARHKVPVWSCVSAGMLVKFRPPPEVKLLCIFGDNDRSFTGQAAAYELARAVTALGVECKVVIPEIVGDWAD